MNSNYIGGMIMNKEELKLLQNYPLELKVEKQK